MLTGIFAWVGLQLQFMQPYGWPEAVFLGVGMTCLVALVGTASLALFRVFRPLPTAATPTPFQASAVSPPTSTPADDVADLRAEFDGLRRMQNALTDSSITQHESNEGLAALAGKIQEAAARIDKRVGALEEWSRLLNSDIARMSLFALRQASIMKLTQLIQEAPNVLPEEELDGAYYLKQTDYLGHLRLSFPGTWRDAHLSEALSRAEHEAEQAIQNSVTAQKLGAGDVIQFRKWLIANIQVERATLFLAMEKRKAEEDIAATGYELSDQFQRRSNT